MQYIVLKYLEYFYFARAGGVQKVVNAQQYQMRVNAIREG